MEAITQTLELIGDQRLVLERTHAENVLKVVGSDGHVKFSISITAAGPVLRFEGSGLLIQSTGPLVIDAQSLVIQGREGLALISGGKGNIRCEGDLAIEARQQNLTAVLGNVNIKANDDVVLDGERIRMNC
jgi:hypothetical protein